MNRKQFNEVRYLYARVTRTGKSTTTDQTNLSRTQMFLFVDATRKPSRYTTIVSLPKQVENIRN